MTDDIFPADFAQPVAPRRRRRAVRWIVAVVIVVIVVGAAVAADSVARNLVDAAAKQAVLEKLDSDPSSTTVTIGGWSMLAQLASGRLSTVTVTAPNSTMTNLSGNISATLDGVPLSGSGTVKSAKIEVTINQAQLASYLAAKGAQGSDSGTISLQGSQIALADQEELFGQKVSVTALLTPKVVGGKLGFTVGQITVGDVRLGSFVSSYVQSKLDTEQVCLASSLPAGLSVNSITVVNGALDIRAAGTSVAFFSGAKGSCS